MVYNAARVKDVWAALCARGGNQQAVCFASGGARRSQCVDIFGGNGFVREYPAEKYYRDAKVGKIYEGTSNMQLMTIAKQVL